MKRPRGTYTPPTKKTRGIVIETEIGDEFNRRATQTLSHEWTAAAVLWMAAKRFPKLEQAVYTASRTLKIKEAIKEVEDRLVDHVLRDLLAESMAALPKKEQAKLLAQANKMGLSRGG